MSDVTLLRKLTEKSCLNFGKYSELKVQDILVLQKTGYLRWVYFNCSKITFIDEILDAIGITNDYRIDKPGTNPEYHEIINEIKEQRATFLSFKTKMHNAKVKKGKALSNFINYRNADATRYSKGALARKNHGH